MKYDHYIGIDPGIKGGLAILNANKDVMYVTPFSENAYKTWLKTCYDNYDYVLVVIEDVHAMPKQGVVSMFNFGKNLGYILGLVDCLGFDKKLVSPNKWKKEFKLSSDKKLSIELVQHLYPQVCLVPTSRSRVPHDGMAEAILLALYGWRCDRGNL